MNVADSERQGARLLVLAPRGRDAALTCELLAEAGLHCHTCADVAELCREIVVGAGAAMVADEALGDEAVACIARTLAGQPPWSDFPFVVFTDVPRTDLDVDRLATLGNVTLLDRPVKVRTMLAAARTAVRARQRQYEARKAIESRDRFLAMLGHELRNPLGAIRLAVDVMDRTEADAAARARHREVIDRQSRHLARLVDDLLDVARVWYGKVRLQAEPLDLAEALTAVLESQAHAAEATGLTLSLRIQGPLRVSGDRVRLEQVFANVLTNAIKYTPRGGSVTVEAHASDVEVVVRVADTGIGLEPAMQHEIFELFTQADRSLARSQGGMGLGLTLVRTLVRLHGGEVDVKSEGLGKGTELTIRLPRSISEEHPTPSPEGPVPTTSVRRKVVVVDDSEDIRSMVQELLELAGHEVSTAEDGPEAVARILDVRPDIAFVDVGLPGFDGYEVARRVRAEHSGGIVLVAVTGYGQADDRRRAEAAGFDRHLTKPVSLVDLEATMTALATRSA